jgi:hypothetical protein
MGLSRKARIAPQRPWCVGCTVIQTPRGEVTSLEQPRISLETDGRGSKLIRHKPFAEGDIWVLSEQGSWLPTTQLEAGGSHLPPASRSSQGYRI